MLTYKSYRYLAAYSPTMPSLEQTYRIAYGYIKTSAYAGSLHQVKVQLEDLLCRRSPNYTRSGFKKNSTVKRCFLPMGLPNKHQKSPLGLLQNTPQFWARFTITPYCFLFLFLYLQIIHKILFLVKNEDE